MIGRFYYVSCDSCGTTTDDEMHQTTQAARRVARRRGWTRVKGSYRIGRDYCPPCAEKRSRSARKLIER